MTDSNKNYIAAEQSFIKLFNLKVGSTVKVLRKAKNHEAGWKNSWNDANMSKQVGKTLTVRSLPSKSNATGVFMDDGYYYPFYALEVFTKPNVEVKLDSGSYTAIINGSTGDIKVGCQNISYDTVKRIYDEATKAKQGIVEEAPAKKTTPKKKVATKKTAKKAAPYRI